MALLKYKEPPTHINAVIKNVMRMIVKRDFRLIPHFL